MIVADCNLLAYLLITGPFTPDAQSALRRDPEWVAPSLWRTEFVNVMATNVRESKFGIDEAVNKLIDAEALVTTVEEPGSDRELIELSVTPRLATFDCTYVLLARRLGVRVVTNDKAMLNRFPDDTISIRAFGTST